MIVVKTLVDGDQSKVYGPEPGVWFRNLGEALEYAGKRIKNWENLPDARRLGIYRETRLDDGTVERSLLFSWFNEVWAEKE